MFECLDKIKESYNDRNYKKTIYYIEKYLNEENDV